MSKGWPWNDSFILGEMKLWYASFGYLKKFQLMCTNSSFRVFILPCSDQCHSAMMEAELALAQNIKVVGNDVL